MVLTSDKEGIMDIKLFFAWFCLAYAAMMFVSGFLKIPVMIKLVKMKFGKKVTDSAAVKIMYVVGVLMLIASVVLFVIR